MSAPHLSIATAAERLRTGGVLAYPTEAVWGLGCDPFDRDAVLRLLAIKRRGVERGVILVAADLAQVAPLLRLDALPEARREAVLARWPGPQTWLLPCTAAVPEWIRGAHPDLAVRISAHPVVVALCRAAGMPLVSTSANTTGMPPAFARDALEPALLEAVDGVVDGETGGLAAPTPIRDARSGVVLRA
ncbi:L-threonylcarbamoyladenylate synthase [Coralloluteibacterium stylophorae]|uniref:Threonylcarbamoyl-AMP synthase n=1 Tax=Coralloluteibacterium stylophorae TaxID=1776034 RepID=A0A8J8AX02_9GAMM|nr:Sua5/YciO/YrdC/YwlC family protein [Coralloluteibacterium stylophorae]MBS7457015.1 Sua5/YciO/YrdC/YwlC family protein [Coralloluteibacterium stylophorae]